MRLMAAMARPDPGSEEAREQGCSCPADQSHGFGLDVWSIHTKCHMHRVVGVDRDGVVLAKPAPRSAIEAKGNIG